MNDRPQGGTADLTSKGSIELMQQRRQTEKDDMFQLSEQLNDVDENDRGVRVNAEYNMQIFKYQEGNSL
jgi:hypothetical protein